MGRQEEQSEAALARFRGKVLGWSGLADVPRLYEALTHPSFAHEGGGADNQRLEFLGDSVLGMVVSEMLAEQHPAADEGVLTRMRSQLVNADALAEFAAREELGGALRLGRGARASGEALRKNVLADAVEAIVASVYFAGGLEAARKVVAAVVAERLAAMAAGPGRDPKSELQERVQAQGRATPRYELVERQGPVHKATFTVEVWVDDEALARGAGPSKKSAERAAAEAALALPAGLAEPAHEP